MTAELRTRLVAMALDWQRRYGVAPAVTAALSEYDAARLVGCSDEDYSLCTRGQTAVQRGHDFMHGDKRYQVKANRPSGRPGSDVTRVGKAGNYEWDFLIWILYDKEYVLQEAWLWEVAAYRSAFEALPRLSPNHMRRGRRIAGAPNETQPRMRARQ